MKKAITILLVIILTILMLVCIITRTEIVDAEDLTLEDLESRNGKLIIERVVGIVNDDDGNGTALYDDSYYICYARVDDACKGDEVLSYFVYNPFNNYFDDILFRLDYVIKE